MKHLLKWIAALTLAATAFGQPSIPVNNLNPLTTGTVVGRSTAGTGRAEILPTTGTGNVVKSDAPTLTGLIGAASLKLSSLTAGRVPIVTTAGLLADSAAFLFDSGTGALSATSFVGPLTGNVTGNVSGSSGSTTGNAATATLAATVTVVDSTDATSFIAMFDSATGSLAPKTDGGLLYDALTGILTATGLAGPLTGNVTGNVSGSSGSTTGNAATATALATGRTISITGDLTYTSPSFDGSANVTAAGTITSSAVTLAKMADLAQDQFIGRTTASTGPPQTATITAAARTVLDDTTVAAMVDTLGGASSLGTGGLVRGTSPTITTGIFGSSTATTQVAGTSDTTLATTAFVQAAVLQTVAKEASKYASTAALPSIVYANGSSGVGATLTGVALAAISLDSSSPAVADRVLIKNQVSTFQNGIYTVTATGSGIAVFVLTRTTDFDQNTDIKTGDSMLVTAGTTLANTTWAVNSADSPVMGTDAITFVQTAGPGSVTSGNGITVTGSSVAINTAVTVDLSTAQSLTNKKLGSLTTNGFVKTSAGDGTLSVDTGAYRAVSFSIDGGGFVLVAGSSMMTKTLYGGTLVGYTYTCQPSGSVTFNILRAANNAGIPTASIINNTGGGSGTGTLPAISSSVEGTSTSFTNWGSTTITANDNLLLAITSPTTATQCNFVLYFQ